MNFPQSSLGAGRQEAFWLGRDNNQGTTDLPLFKFSRVTQEIRVEEIHGVAEKTGKRENDKLGNATSRATRELK